MEHRSTKAFMHAVEDQTIMAMGFIYQLTKIIVLLDYLTMTNAQKDLSI